jgi:ATP-binding cassette subfamily C protein
MDALLALGAGMLLGLFGMIVPAATGEVIDSIIPSAQVNALVQVGAFLLAIAIAGALIQLSRTASWLRVETRTSSELQAAVWDRLLCLPVSFFREYSAGDLAMRTNGIDAMRRALSGATMTAIMSSVFSLMNFFMMITCDLRLAMLAGALALVSVTVAAGIGLRKVMVHRKLAAIEGKLSSLVLQIINGILKLRIASAERRVFAVWAKSFAELRTLNLGVRKLESAMMTFDAVYPILVTMVIFFFAPALNAPKALSTGQFVTFYGALGIFTAGLAVLVEQGVELLKLVPIYERVRPILATPPEADELKVAPGPLKGAIQVSRVTFRYDTGGPLVLDDVDFEIHPGEFIAIVGGSGAGKSTLLRIILGFERATQGGVFYDRKDLASLDVTEVRRQIGVVLQNGRPIAGSIYENISGALGISRDQAWEAARMAGFEDDINAMPMGMDTLVDQGGFSLSGGQRQRLLIARALVSKPRIIFFDEATSALDNTAQSIVTESLESLQATRVVIAHRLSTIRNADRIVVLDRGRIAEIGTYDALMEKEGGVFASIAKRQLA